MPIIDETQDLQRLFDSVPIQGGGDVFLEARQYFVTDNLRIRRPVRIHGKGASSGNGGTKFLFSAGKGVIFDWYNTPGTENQRADGAILENVEIISDDPSIPDNHGIQIKAPNVTLRDVTVRSFAGNGVNIHASVPASNANTWRMVNVWATLCKNGFYCAGSDANAGIAVGCSATDCKDAGFWDHSFLGNTWIGCHADNCPGAGYRADSLTAWATFVGCYAEMNCGPAQLSGAAVCIGGAQAAGIRGSGFFAARTADAEVGTLNQHAVLCAGLGTSHQPLALLRVGSDIDSGSGGYYFAFTHRSAPGRVADPLYCGNFVGSAAGAGGWERPDAKAWMGFSRNPAVSPPTRIALTSTATDTLALVPGSAVGPPRLATPGAMWLQGFLLGGWADPSCPVQVFMTSGIEGMWATGQSGVWQTGDIVFNVGPSGPLAWRCTAPGTDLPMTDNIVAEVDGGSFLWIHDASTGELRHTDAIRVGQVVTVGTTRRTATVIDVDGMPGKIHTWEPGGFPLACQGLPVRFTPPVMEARG